MNQPFEKSERPMSEIARKFIEDPALEARCQEIADAIQQAARKDIEACDRSTQFTAADWSVTIF